MTCLRLQTEVADEKLIRLQPKGVMNCVRLQMELEAENSSAGRIVYELPTSLTEGSVKADRLQPNVFMNCLRLQTEVGVHKSFWL